jgi:murein DD-endopeptidase MepM/ murein hydrolase activator NlpD
VLRVRLRGGDTLWGLARRYGTTVAALQRLNRLGTSTMIYAGAVLEVPGGPGKPLSAATAEDVSVTRTASRVTETSSSHGSLRQLAAEVFGAQYPCAAAIITRESGWQVHALNPSSGAYGLAQALPGSKMAAAGPAWRDDPATQLRWMRSYVDSSYGGACAAWSFWQAHSWY